MQASSAFVSSVDVRAHVEGFGSMNDDLVVLAGTCVIMLIMIFFGFLFMIYDWVKPWLSLDFLSCLCLCLLVVLFPIKWCIGEPVSVFFYRILQH